MELALPKRGRLACNHTELAYREAVAKLKYLLAESYASPSREAPTLASKGVSGADESSEEEAEARASSRGKLLAPAPAELRALIERQEDYIEQLEKESHYCREELRALVDKVREVVAENEALQDKGKTRFFEGAGLEQGEQAREKQQQPSIVLQSRVSELEAQLTQARLELRQAREQGRGELAFEREYAKSPQLRAELERERRERRGLEARVEERERELARLRDRDSEAQLRARRSGELAQQADCQRLQAELELARLRGELERRQDELREVLQEGGRRLAEEKRQTERRFGQQLERLSGELAAQWQAASAGGRQADEHKRQIAELGRELDQSRDLAKDLQQKTVQLQEQLSRATAEREAALEQLASSRQEQAQLQAEVGSYKARLDGAEAELLLAKREHLRLSDELAALDKQISMSRVVQETRVGSVQPGPSQLTVDKSKEERHKDKELAALIHDLEGKHAASSEGLGPDQLHDPNDSAALASSKKRRVKVDLKVKVIPKKKSAQSEPLSKAANGQSSKQNNKVLGED